MPLLILTLFIGIPLIEIYLFIGVGGLIGTWPTITLVILTAFIGTAMLRQQGIATMARAQAELRDGQLPVQQFFNGFCVLLGGLMLLTPGFLTDTLGFGLLLPPLRAVLGRGIWKLFAQSGRVHFPVYGSNPSDNTGKEPDAGPVLDAEEFGVTRDDSAPDPDTPQLGDRA